MATSERADNTNELVQFTTPSTETYKLQVKKWSGDSSPGSVAVAWDTRTA